MRVERKLFLTSFFVALVVVGISGYFFLLAQNVVSQSRQIDVETLEQMSRDELVRYILTRHEEGGLKLGFYILPVAVFVSAIVGTFVAYFLLTRSEQARERASVNAKILLNLLRDDERKVVETLLNHGGEMRQYELVYGTGLHKVKVHRILKALEDRGVIIIEKVGKVNNVRLRKEIYEALKE